MKRIVSLLEQKNHYLEKFASLNEEEIGRFMENNFDNLETFYNAREHMLEIINYIDSQIKLDEPTISAESISDYERKAVKELLKAKGEYVNHIIQQDLEILACIDHTKSEIIRELQEIKKNKKAVSGYKSPLFGSRLDEEA
ncbi:MAG: hypothetical protein V4736_10570 [Bdellovibrionota bacterium]